MCNLILILLFIIGILAVLMMFLVGSTTCNDCPFKDSCKRSIQNGTGRLCDNNDFFNPFHSA